MFRQAIESWLANRVTEVILVIDSSDRVCQAIGQTFVDAGHPVRVIMTDVPGQAGRAASGAGRRRRTPLVALVDSDTIWADDVADEVAMPFADPTVGGVSTRQNVYNPRGFLQRVNDMYLDYRYFDENAAQTAFGRAVSCISGRTAVYRRELLLEIGDEFMAETFLGVPCMSGDDKRLTSLILMRGHKAVLQRTARVWSTFPGKTKIFFKQRLRWARNTWRSDLRACRHRAVGVEVPLPRVHDDGQGGRQLHAARRAGLHDARDRPPGLGVRAAAGRLVVAVAGRSRCCRTCGGGHCRSSSSRRSCCCRSRWPA